MIKLKLKQIDSDWKEYEIVKDSTLSVEVSHVLKSIGLEGKEEFFAVLVDGIIVDAELWEFTKVTKESKVEIYPKLKGGGFGQIFKLVVVIAAVVTVSILTAGTATAPLLTALAGIGTSLLMNALIPPPGLGSLGGSGGVDSSSESQMYSVGAQSNVMSKYGAVPRVYGVHRMYPKVVANPYTEIETDVSTKELVQYFYAIYDFGYGPNVISDIRIGDTPIIEFADLEYRLVDFHRPEVDEGIWDEGLQKELTFYKGDVSTEPIGTFLNANQSDGGAAEDYRLVRLTGKNPTALKAEITITFINPSGLIAYGTDGSTHARNINLKVEFRKVGDSSWKSFNDIEEVYSHSMAGGTNVVTKLVPDPNLWTTGFGAGVEDLGLVVSSSYLQTTFVADADFNPPAGVVHRYVDTLGIPSGSTVIYLTSVDPSVLIVGGSLQNGTTFLGKILSVTPETRTVTFDIYGPWTVTYTRYKVVIDRPTTYRIDAYSRLRDIKYPYGYGSPPPITEVHSVTTNPNAYDFRVASGACNISRRSAVATYSSLKFTPKEAGQYEVRITRLSSSSATTFNVIDSLAIQSISTRLDSNPINTPNRHTFLEIKIRATNQLNGSIQNLSATTSSVLPVYDGSDWKLEQTNNPAWIVADLITGTPNKRAVGKDRLHLPSLLEWRDYCDEVPPPHPDMDYVLPRYTSNFVLDFGTTVQEIIGQVAGACQASLNIVDGKYGILLDKQRNIPVQVFTPRNSNNFSSQRIYLEAPHGLKVTFIEPAASWEMGETVVYSDGYSEANAETFEDMQTFGCTNEEQAWRFGRYMLAQAIYRQETISIQVDFENLVCTRGDYVRICQDVMKVGGIPARVKSILGNIVTLDEGLTIGPLITLGYLVRSYDGIFQGDATIISADQVQLTGTLPRVGDLIIIGELDKVWYDCIVKSISPMNDFMANLVLVEKADEVYLAESTGLLGDYTPQISDILDSDSIPKPVTDLEVVRNSWTCGANSFEYFIEIDWDVPPSTAYEYFQVMIDYGKGFDIVAETKESDFVYFVKPQNTEVEHAFKVIAVSASGKRIEVIEADTLLVTPSFKSERPLDVPRLSTNITNEVLQLDWEATRDCIREYLIRYSPDVEGSWEQSIPLLRADKNTTMASTQARTGVYLIKAVDFNDVESQTATRAITTIPELFNLNIIETTDDFPLLEGSKVRVESVGDTLMLRLVNTGGTLDNEYYTSGYYYYKSFLDMGEIYTVRLQSYIRAEGYTLGDLMYTWTSLADVEALSRSRYSEWDVETEYRATDAENIMAEWPSLSVVDPISEGFQDNWTPWRKFTVNDATGRLMQFRLHLISNKAAVTPRVFDGLIKADMPDRVESWQNLISDPIDGSAIVTYAPSFKGPGTTPSIQVSIDNSQAGDHYAFDYKNLDGFRIIFYDSNGNPVSRQFDIAVAGYGRKANAII